MFSRSLCALAFLLVASCAPDADGGRACRPGAQRCNGEAMEVCVADAVAREFLWTHVVDCDVEEAAHCVVTDVEAQRVTCALASGVDSGVR